MAREEIGIRSGVGFLQTRDRCLRRGWGCLFRGSKKFCKKFLTEFLLTEPDVQLVPSSASLLDPFEQLEDRQTESIGDDLDRIQRRVSLSVLDTAEIRLIKPAPFAKLDLAHPSGETELAHAGAESLCQGIFHTPNYVVYAINRINTNSYK